MNAREKGLKGIAELIEATRNLHSNAPKSGEGFIEIGAEELWRVLVSALQATRSICSEESPHYQELIELRTHFRSGGPFETQKFIGILCAVEDDLRNGLLVNIREMVTAEVFDDMIDMATYLLEQGYHLPAIAITGAVLEDTLRKLCEKNYISWIGDSSISKLNTALYKANTYDKVQFSQVDAWGKLRNKVDHGDFKSASEVDHNDAERMVVGLRDFVARHLTT